MPPCIGSMVWQVPRGCNAGILSQHPANTGFVWRHAFVVLDMQALGSSRECSSVSHLVELCWPLVAGGHVNVVWHCSVLACAELRWFRRCRLLCVLASRAKSALTMHRCLDRMSGVCCERNDSMSSSCRLTITLNFTLSRKAVGKVPLSFCLYGQVCTKVH